MTFKKQTLNMAFWLFGISLSIFAFINQKYFKYDHIFIQFIVTLFACLFGIYLCLNTKQGLNFHKYWLSSVAELKKVTWPKKKEIMQVTVAVIVMVLVTGLILWTVDSILIRLVTWLLQRRW